MRSDNELVFEIQAPSHVPEQRRSDFEGAATSFLLGHDRLRPELVSELSSRGVDTQQLQRLCAPEPLGLCPVPGAREIVPDDVLSRLGAEKGVSWTDGGRIRFEFNYDAGDDDTRKLVIRMLAPRQVGRLSEEQVGSITRAVFGDCSLSSRAQDYLRGFGIDAVRFAQENAQALAERDTPMTTRVSPEAEALLTELGFDTNKFGRLEVISVDDLRSEDQGSAPVWTKTTCC